MLARIIPLVRLPKDFVDFSYTIPENYFSASDTTLEQKKCSSLLVGHIVQIPFRNKKILGLVRAIEDTNSVGLKPIIQLVNPTPFLGSSYITFLTELAHLYGVSVSVMAKIALPPLQITKYKKTKLSEWIEHQKKPEKAEYYYYKNTAEHQDAFVHYNHEALAIIVPEITKLQEVLSLLPQNRAASAVLWHSELSIKEQQEVWHKIRNHEVRTLIGTRGAVFLPLTQSFDRIVIDYEQSSNHKHWDQSPRFMTKDIGKLLHRNFGLSYTEMSYSPSTASYFYVHKKNYEIENKDGLTFPTIKTLDEYGKPLPIIINNEGSGKQFSEPIIRKIETCIASEEDGDIVFLVNQKGYASAVICRDCGERTLCPRCALPLVYHARENDLKCHYCGHSEATRSHCAECRSPFIRLGGSGIESIAANIEDSIQKNNDWKIVLVDAGSALENNQEKRIIIGTDAALKIIRWEKLRCIVFVDFDRRFAMPELMAQEDLWHLIHEIQFYKPKTTPFYIQTRKPEHGLLRSLTEPDRWYRLELNHRQALQFPPYSYVVRYLAPGNTADAARVKTNAVLSTINTRLTNEPKKIILHGPLIAEPAFVRGNYWSIIIAKISESSITEATHWLTTMIPPDWKIDPNPRSLLSPH